MRKGLFWLNNKQWARIEPHLPTNQTGPARDDDRRIVSGIIHMGHMKVILAKIAAVLAFIGTAALVAVGVRYFACDSFGVSRAVVGENALISAVLLSGILLVGLFANISGNQK